MRQAKIDVHMLKKYVDDANLCIAIVEHGWFWKRDRGMKPVFLWTQEREILDKEEALSKEERTIRKIQELANMLVDGIKFTVDLRERYTSGRVPMFDLAV